MVSGGVASARIWLNLPRDGRGNSPSSGSSSRAHSEHGDDPIRSVIGIEVEVVEMLRNGITAGADRVAGGTVGPQTVRPLIQIGQIGAITGDQTVIIGAVQDVIRLAGCMTDVSKDCDGLDCTQE